MNSSDIKLILIIFLIATISLITLHFLKSNDKKTAHVYYDNELVLSIDLSVAPTQKYVVDGYNGDVIIEVDKGRIRVAEETSPLHLCSKMGWIKESFESIVCLPNKVVIIIEAQNKIDTVIR